MTNTEKLKLIANIITEYYEYHDEPTVDGVTAVLDVVLTIKEFGGAGNGK